MSNLKSRLERLEAVIKPKPTRQTWILVEVGNTTETDDPEFVREWGQSHPGFIHIECKDDSPG